jgi:hypothetical protein
MLYTDTETCFLRAKYKKALKKAHFCIGDVQREPGGMASLLGTVKDM